MIKTYDQFIKRIGDGYWMEQPMWSEITTASVTPASNNMPIAYSGFVKTLPTPLPSGVTKYIITSVNAGSTSSLKSILFGKLINLGSLDISTPTFTDGSTMGTAKELGIDAATLWSPVIAQVTTALNATPGNYTITYVDQNNNAAEASSSVALPVSAPVNSAFWVPLNSGDYGVTDITTAGRTSGTTPTGVIKFWGMIPIALFFTSASFAGPNQENLLTKTFNPVRLGAGDTVGCFSMGSTATRCILGSMYVVGDN